MKFVIVCQHCNNHAKEDDPVTMEINFRDTAIYFLCMNCNKMNKMLMQPAKPTLPKTRLA